MTIEGADMPIIGCCGLVCSECPAFVATQTGDEEKIRRTALMWSAEYSLKVEPKDVWCDGCMTEGRKCAHCGECPVRDCGESRNVKNCAECADYPCDRIEGFFKMVPQAKFVLDGLVKKQGH